MTSTSAICDACGQPNEPGHSCLAGPPPSGATSPETPAAVGPLPDPALEGRVLNGAYRIDAKISEGGMGLIYKGTQLTLGRTVAIKVIRPTAHLSGAAEQRFLREARLLSQLNHPNVVSVIDFGTAEPGPLPFLVMEFLQGEPLDLYVTGRPRPALPLVLNLFGQICAGVVTAHQQGVIHRDLKPANVFVVPVSGSVFPVAKVLDFGLAKPAAGGPGDVRVTLQGMMVGTCGYTGPEQFEGRADPDARSDVYSLGAILYFLLTGRPAFAGDTAQAILLKQMTGSPPPIDFAGLGLPEAAGLEPVIRKAMSHDPADRYQTVPELVAAVRAAADHLATPASERATQMTPVAPAGPNPPPATPPARPTRRAVLAAGAGLAGLAAAGAAWWWLREDGRATAPGVTADAVRLGMCAPFTGPSRELGRAMRLGVDTCFQEVNAAGGVHGRKLQLVALDDGYEPERTAARMRELLDQHQVFAFVGNVGTPTTAAALPLALEAKRVFFGAYTGAGLLRQDPPDRYVFNFRASYAEETAKVVAYLVEVRRVDPKGIAVFAQEDAYGEAGFMGVTKALRKYGLSPQDIPRVGYPRNTTVVAEAVRELVNRRERPQAVVMVATYRPAAAFIQQARDAGLAAVFCNVSFVGTAALAELLRDLGPRYADGVIVTQVVPHYESGATGVLRFREALQKYSPQEAPDFISLEGYLAGQVLAEGLRRAGADLTSETLVEGLEGIRGLDLAIGTPITFGPSEHQGSHKVWGTVLDGKGRVRTLDLN